MAETRAVPQCDEPVRAREEPVSWRDGPSVWQATIAPIATRPAQRTSGIWRPHGRRRVLLFVGCVKGRAGSAIWSSTRHCQRTGPRWRAPPQRQHRKYRIAVRVTGAQAHTRYQRECERPVSDRLNVGDGADVQQKRALDSHKTSRGQRSIEPLDRLARNVFNTGEVVCNVVARRLDVVDLVRIQRVEPMLALADEKVRPASIAFTRRGGHCGRVPRV